MRNVRRTGSRTSDAIERSFRRLGARLAQAIAVAIPAIGGLAIRQAAEFERLRVSLDALNISSAEGARNFERLVQFSAQTPFQLKDLARNQIALQGFGLSADEAFESLQRIGDIASIIDADITRVGIAFGQAAAEGRVRTRDLLQFINAGVPIVDLLSKTMGRARNEILKLTEEGAVTFEVLEQAFKDATSAGGQFFEGTEKAQATLSGAFSNLRDNTNIFLAALGEVIADTVDLEANTRTLSDRFADMANNMQTVEDVASGVRIAFQRLRDEVTVLGFSIGQTFSFLRENFETAFGITGIQTAIGGITEGLRRMGEQARESAEQMTDDYNFVEEMLANINPSIDENTESTRNWNAEALKTANSINDIRSALDEMPTPQIFDPSNEAIEQMRSLSDIMRDISNQDTSLFDDRLPDAGTIADLNAQMDVLREKMMQVSTPEQFAPLNAQMEKLRNRIAAIKGETEEMTPEFNRFGREAAQVFDRLIFQGERFSSILTSILRQLATRQIAKFIGGAIGVGSGGFLGGLLGSVGVGSVAPQSATSSRNITLNLKGELTGQGSTLKAIIDETSTDLTRLT